LYLFGSKPEKYGMKLPRVLTTDLARDLGNLTTAIPGGFLGKISTPVHQTLTTLSATLSLLGTVLIISTYFAWKDLRSTSRRILVFISIADFFIAGSYLFGTWFHTDMYRTTSCIAQSFVSSTASLWSFFWTAFLAVFMYITVAKKQRSKAEILLKVFHFIGWGVPLIIVGAALKEGALGDGRDLFTSGWCWISPGLPKKERYLWMLMTGKAWEVTAYILSFVFYFMLKFHIRKQVFLHKRQFPSDKSADIALKAERKLTLVPIIFVLVRIWGTIRFILYSYADIGVHYSWWDEGLLYLQGIGNTSQGFANFLLFCLFTEKFQARFYHVARDLLIKFKCCLPVKVKTVKATRYNPGPETPLIESASMTQLESSHKTYETCQSDIK